MEHCKITAGFGLQKAHQGVLFLCDLELLPFCKKNNVKYCSIALGGLGVDQKINGYSELLAADCEAYSEVSNA